MIKSLYAYFDTDKLFVITPTVVALDENENTILKSLDNEIDIALIDENGINGLITKRKYFDLNLGVYDLNAYYLSDNNKIQLIKYLFESTYGTSYTKEMFDTVKNMKRYYEIEELDTLYNNIKKNDQKIKSLKRFN